MKEQKVLNDKLTADDILREAAALAKEDVLATQQSYEDRAKSIGQIFDVQPDAAFLQFARTYDQQHAAVSVKKKSKARMKRFARFAAIFLACFITMGSLALGTSEALREKVFTLIFNDETGSVSLRTESEEDMIGSWENYWYPAWLPEGFYMLGAERGNYLFMLFVSQNDPYEIRIREYSLNGTSIGLDTDTAEIEEIKVGHKNVVLSVDETNCIMSAAWMTDTKILKIDVNESTDREMLIKIIENMQYIN